MRKIVSTGTGCGLKIQGLPDPCFVVMQKQLFVHNLVFKMLRKKSLECSVLHVEFAETAFCLSFF